MILPLLFICAAPGQALIITNNKSLDASRPELRYADDDGIAYATLFDERYGQDNVTLLTELDVDSRRLYPAWTARAHVPTREGVLAAVKAIAEKATQGSDVYLVFAGHGDTERGRGYVELLDGRFYADELEAVVTALEAKARLHLVLDSCNSYFMLNPRKPGGARFTSEPKERASFLERHKNTGAIISTSAEAETYEWSEIQSGIFSYVLRSGLRGAADANGDGHLTYQELDAFVAVATRPIVNEHYRPRTFAQGLSGDLLSEFFALPNDPTQTRIIKRAGRAERITVRDDQGVRIIDMNADAGTAFELRLPKDTGRFEVVSYGKVRISATLLRGKALVLDEATFGVESVASRGDAQVFATLFNEPFGAASVEAHVREPETEAAFGISEAKAERFRLMLKTFSDGGESQRRSGALAMLGGASIFGVGSAALLVAGAASFTADRTSGAILMGSAGGAAIAGLGLMVPGLIVWKQQSEEEKIYATHMQEDLGTPEARAKAVAKTERMLFSYVSEVHQARMRSSSWVIASGAIGLAAGAVYLGLAYAAPQRFGIQSSSGFLYPISGAILMGVGANNILSGILMRTPIAKTPMERMWDLYEASENGEAAATQPASLEWSLAPFVAPGERGGINAGLGGSLKF